MTGSDPSAPQTTSDVVIALEDVSKSYTTAGGEVAALQPTSLTFRQGEFTAIMGPSGSGKSTLLNILGLLDRPSGGRYTLAKQTVSELNDDAISDIRCRSIGFVFQSFNLFPNLNILENVCVPMRYAECPPKEMQARAEQLLQQLGLGERLHHRPTQLSGGQCQRVAIARSLANDPPVLLADEPTGNLDAKTGDEVLSVFRSLAEEGRLVIMVTHNPEYRNRVDRVIELRDGVAEEA